MIHEGKIIGGTFRLGELFCGAGGLAYGALDARSSDESLQVEHRWATDIDPDSCQTYINNICGGKGGSVTCADIRNLDLNTLEPIDALAFGFPCNSFSNVGKHKGLAHDKFGQLYLYGVKALCIFKPKWFIAENVSGIKSAGERDFHIILNDIRNAGYDTSTHLYWAERYGVPQKRHRVIIVGIRRDLGLKFRIPSPDLYKEMDVTAGKALEDIAKDAPNNEIHRLSKKVAERLQYIEPGQSVWDAIDNIPEHLRLKSTTKISQIYRKLHPSEPSYTITAAGGGGTFGYHWDNRELTNRERARLQTFPDDYVFYGNFASVRKQIGMAVPCRLSRIVTKAILDTFAGIPYPYIKSNLPQYN